MQKLIEYQDSTIYIAIFKRDKNVICPYVVLFMDTETGYFADTFFLSSTIPYEENIIAEWMVKEPLRGIALNFAIHYLED